VLHQERNEEGSRPGAVFHNQAATIKDITSGAIFFAFEIIFLVQSKTQCLNDLGSIST